MSKESLNFLDINAITISGAKCHAEYFPCVLNIVRNRRTYFLTNLSNMELMWHGIDCYIALHSPESFVNFVPKSRNLNFLITHIEQDIKQITLPAAVCCWLTDPTNPFRIEQTIINPTPITEDTDFNPIDYIDEPFVLESIRSIKELESADPGSALNYAYGALLDNSTIPDRAVFKRLFVLLLLKENRKELRYRYKNETACQDYVTDLCRVIKPGLNVRKLFDVDEVDLI